MLRRWHRLIVPFFAAFLLIVAGTGIAIQVTDLADQPAQEAKPARVSTSPCQAKPARPKRTPMGEWNHWFKKLHSGEIAGPAGTAIGIASGVALLFFAGSGFWMYLSMLLRRRRARV
jgi:hypothetical protein